MNTRLNVLQESTLSFSLSFSFIHGKRHCTNTGSSSPSSTNPGPRENSVPRLGLFQRFNQSFSFTTLPYIRVRYLSQLENLFFSSFEKKLSTDVTVDEERAFVSLKVASSRDLGDLREHLTRQRCNTPPVASPPLTSVQTPRAPARAAHVGQLTPSGETSGPFAS